MPRVFAPTAFRWTDNVDYPYGWQDIPDDSKARAMKSAGKVVDGVVDTADDITSVPALQALVSGYGNLTRHRIASIGNSINSRNSASSSGAGVGGYDAWGFVTQAYALSNGGFDRITSTAATYTTNPITGGANGSGQNEAIDAFGCYAAPGATTAQILLRLPIVVAAWTQAPTVIWLGALAENDMAQGVAAATTIANVKAILGLLQRAYPNALVILSSPGACDNYNSGAKQQAMRDVRAWTLALSAKNVLIEQNDSLMINTTNGEMDVRYGSDTATQGAGNVHPNELGALVRARAFLAQFPTLFATPLVLPTGWGARTSADSDADTPGNVTGTPGQNCAVNPAFLRTGSPGESLSGIISKGYNFYNDTGVGKQIALTANGLQLDIWKGAGFAGGGVGPTSDSAAFTLSNQLGGTFQSHFRVRVLNPTGILSLRPTVNISGGTAQTIEANFTQGTFTRGIESGLRVGDVLLFSTAPYTITGGNNQIAYHACKCNILASLPQEAAFSGRSPSLEYLAETTIRIA